MKRPTWRRSIPMLLALACVVAGCGRVKDRAFPADRGVIALTDAEWAQTPDGRLVLVGGRFKAEKGMDLEDIRYNYRNVYLLTPGFVAELLEDPK